MLRAPGFLVLAGVLAHSFEAGACTCQVAKTRILLAAATNRAPLAGPWLVMHPGDAKASLEDELGTPQPGSVVRSYSLDSLCRFRLELLRPDVPLVADEWYRLSLVGPSGNDTRAFKASARPVKSVERLLKVSLENYVYDGVMSQAGCSHPKYDDLHFNGYFGARIETDAPALLFLEVSAADSTFGQIVEGWASIDEGESSPAAVTTTAHAAVVRLDTTAACARVVVRDALDVTVYDQELCPEPGKTLGSEQTVSVAEHLIRDPPSEPIDDGCGCRARPSGQTGFASLGLLVLALLGRRRRDGTPRTGVRP